MTKIYLVCREVYRKDIMLHDILIVGAFTNKKKANSLVRWYNAKDIQDKKSYPNLYEEFNPKNFVKEREIDTFDFTEAAIKLETENLPF